MNSVIRCGSLIDDVIKKLNLDLYDKIVLTEVGSSLFVLTPIIAIKAGAKKVYAWGKDNRYGKASDCIALCKKILVELDCESSNIEFASNDRVQKHIEEADVITNLGNVRPLDENFLKYVKNNAVIPLMCEAWEIRHSDIDIDF